MHTPLLWALAVMTIGTAVFSLAGAVWARLRRTRRAGLVPARFAALGFTVTVLVWIWVFVEYSRPGVYPSAIPLILAAASLPLAFLQFVLARRRG